MRNGVLLFILSFLMLPSVVLGHGDMNNNNDNVIQTDERLKQQNKSVKSSSGTSNVIMYAQKPFTLKKHPEEDQDSLVNVGQDIAVLSQEVTLINGVEWHLVTVFDRDSIFDGWIESEYLTEEKPNYESSLAQIEERIKVETKEDEVWIHNSLINAINQFNHHVNELQTRDFNVEKFLEKFPVVLRLVDLDELPGGERYWIYPGIMEIGIDKYNSYIPKNLVVHQFAHHIGYKVVHGGDSESPGDFSGFAQFRDLKTMELGRSDIAWEDRNQEIFAESYTEVFVENYRNRSSTGNFENNKIKNDFFEWVKEEVNSQFFDDADENKDKKIMYAKNELKVRENHHKDSLILSKVKRGLAVLSRTEKSVNGNVWHQVTVFEQGRKTNGWVNGGDLTDSKLENITTFAEIQHRLDIETIEDKIWLHNSKINAIDMFNSHIDELKEKSFDIEGFLELHPVIIRIMDINDLPNGGRYWIYPGVMEIAVRNGNSHITKQIIVHEFSHHVGYKAIHGGDSEDPGDFSGFAQYRKLESLELGRDDIPWEDRNQEKFAESYSEVFLNNYKNRSSTGNFENEDKKQAFFDWVIEEVNAQVQEVKESEIDTQELEELVNKVNEYNKEKYTEESYKEVMKYLEMAKDILSNETSTQSEVDLAAEKLLKSIEGLKVISDKSKKDDSDYDSSNENLNYKELKDLIEKSNELVKNNESNKSISTLIDKLNIAKKVLLDPDVNQIDIDSAAEMLQQELKNFAEQSEVDEQGDSNKEINKEGRRLPDTATNTHIFIVTGALLFLLGISLYFKKRLA